MPGQRIPDVSRRKSPKQARSSDLVAAVLDAAVQVLRREGAARFTTARVAERAGVSVGSLYQYFPNKAAILFRLQADEWGRTTGRLRAILETRDAPPAARLREAVHAFILSECDEALVRLALADAAPLYRDDAERDAMQERDADLFHALVDEALPGAAPATRSITADLIEATLTQVGAGFSEAPRSPEEIAAYADAMADMFCAYLASLGAAGAGHPAQAAR